jgi:hypothetical protein
MGRLISSLIFTLLFFMLFFCLPVLASDRFTDNKDGTITDHQLGLMWATMDNLGDVSWHQAEKWIRFTFPFSLPVQYDNWRLPTLDELKSLYIRDKSYHGYESNCGQRLKITPEIKLSCGFIWSGDRQNVSAYVFNFSRGTFYSDRLVHNRGYRALAVRDLLK